MTYITLNTGHFADLPPHLEPFIQHALMSNIHETVAVIPRLDLTRCIVPTQGGGWTIYVSRRVAGGGICFAAAYGLATTATSTAVVWEALENAAQMYGIEVKASMPSDTPYLAALLLPAAVLLTREELMMLADYAGCLALTLLQQRNLERN